LKRTQIYAIIKNLKEGKPTIDQRKLKGRRKVRNPAFIANVTADIEKDWRVTVKKLALALGMSKNTIYNALHQDLNLSKNWQDGSPNCSRMR
jgi:hypothetical protein